LRGAAALKVMGSLDEWPWFWKEQIGSFEACNENKREGNPILSGTFATLEALGSVPGFSGGVVSVEDSVSVWARGGWNRQRILKFYNVRLLAIT
jgi:hypothetical protein